MVIQFVTLIDPVRWRSPFSPLERVTFSPRFAQMKGTNNKNMLNPDIPHCI